MNIRALRAARGLSQEDLGKEVGLSRQTVARIEAGEVDPRAEVISKLSTILGATLGEVMAAVAAARTDAELGDGLTELAAKLEAEGIEAGPLGRAMRRIASLEDELMKIKAVPTSDELASGGLGDGA